jgi:putative ABC transport system permease protein
MPSDDPVSDTDRSLFRPRASDEVEQEFDFHVEMRAREYIAQGMTPDEARRRAEQRFGDMRDVKRTCTTLGHQREQSMKRAAMMSEFRQDVKHAAGLLRRTPLLTAMILLTLGLGIGANTALFSVVKAVLLAPLPYDDPDRVVMLWSRWKDFPEKTWVSSGEYQNYVENVRSLSGLSLIGQFETSITEGDQPERVGAYSVTPGIFATLGVGMERGRTFTAEDVAVEQPEAVILSHALWQSRYAGDDAAIGRTILINGAPRTIVGVLPSDFRLPLDYRASSPGQLWFPLVLPDPTGVPPFGGSHGFYAIGRLAPGATTVSANAELATVTSQLTADGVYPVDWNFGAFVVTADDEVAGTMRSALLVLLGAVGFVLLIACANVTNLLLVRAEDRRRELSVRSALGASRSRLVRQLLSESLVLGVAGGALGLAFAAIGVRALVAIAPATLPRMPEVRLDSGVLAFTVILGVLTALLFGLLPAIQGSRPNVHGALKESGRANTTGVQRARVRQAMVVAQVALAVVLVAGAGLLLRSFARLTALDPGFDAERVLTARLAAPAAFYPEPRDVNAFYDRVLREVRDIPGVRHAGLVRVLPIDTEIGDSNIQVPGYNGGRNDGAAPADWQAASDGYFEALGLRLAEGRFFTDADRTDSEQVIIVNEAFVNAYMGGGTAIGRHISFAFTDSTPPQRIVGVVRNARHNGITGDIKPTFYRPHQQWVVSTGFAQRNMTLVIRAESDPAALAPAVRTAISRVDARLPISNVKTMGEVMSTALAQPRFTMLLLLMFSGLALALAIIGIYGVVSYVVTQRRQELGIRIALGAQPRGLVLSTLRGAAAQAALGVAGGILAALALTRAMRGLLYDTSATDPATFLGVAGLVLAAALVASFIPARRAARADPLTAMRSD